MLSDDNNSDDSLDGFIVYDDSLESHSDPSSEEEFSESSYELTDSDTSQSENSVESKKSDTIALRTRRAVQKHRQSTTKKSAAVYFSCESERQLMRLKNLLFNCGIVKRIENQNITDSKFHKEGVCEFTNVNDAEKAFRQFRNYPIQGVLISHLKSELCRIRNPTKYRQMYMNNKKIDLKQNRETKASSSSVQSVSENVKPETQKNKRIKGLRKSTFGTLASVLKATMEKKPVNNEKININSETTVIELGSSEEDNTKRKSEGSSTSPQKKQKVEEVSENIQITNLNSSDDEFPIDLNLSPSHFEEEVSNKQNEKPRSTSKKKHKKKYLHLYGTT